MALILSIETSTRNCSVALARNGELLALKEHAEDSYTHAEELHPFIQHVLQSASCSLNQLDAVAVSKGPGSYTGLRIGVSAAKGLCYALNIPLLAIDSLSVLFNLTLALSKGEGRKSLTPTLSKGEGEDFDFIVPMIDARRMEVYTTTFTPSAEMISPIDAKIIDENFFLPFQNKRIGLCGDGAEKCRPFLNDGHKILPIIFPSALGMIEFAEKAFAKKQFEDTAYFEPFYLKDFLPGKVKTQ
ncbi:MAG: tRNA (adenosine(37)-N6)-threonylcarbamoyltransferase complex dimerization subunit type 1 TsaB [Flavobacteriales bacterium]|nr:tRNA (adenosine(37)-N6)-threonylcarbamoyltransferase complex dimerization subunit type 1 TsaB [Flavobacteriales bacterium]